ncbi:hypothetical protein DUNSADRAFT_14766 [Dunaliella salina]|uniref:Uncharacterized protein n=1 Tax=Dunaliella salina TaxID=3046 RepID=A0ABQ7G6S8_DUNSA|nr:hypothetical protein DUNSADRAFT_14766 [Dunaliella salina]|eukprot:KAF5830312.1 hypothetical protein DUNSADRAFT_14766 [Dunaliella salina]
MLAHAAHLPQRARKQPLLLPPQSSSSHVAACSGHHPCQPMPAQFIRWYCGCAAPLRWYCGCAGHLGWFCGCAAHLRWFCGCAAHFGGATRL